MLRQYQIPSLPRLLANIFGSRYSVFSPDNFPVNSMSADAARGLNKGTVTSYLLGLTNKKLKAQDTFPKIKVIW
jgi:hypothetical protein